MDEITFIYNIDDIDIQPYEAVYYQILTAAKETLNISQTLLLSVTFIDPKESIKINTEYRNKTYVGDVISFPIDDPSGIYEQLDFKEIGDIFITPAEAKSKAALYNHTFFEEMTWLFTHGLLHILGYDHELGEIEAKQMFELTDIILKAVNVVYKIV